MFSGISQICDLTKLSGAFDDRCYDGNTILLELELLRKSESKNLQILGSGIYTLTTNEEVINYISIMGNIMIPYPKANGENIIFGCYIQFEFIKNGKI